MKNCIVTLLLLLVAVVEMKGQCYDETRATAINELKSQKFESASAMFKAAKACPDRPEKTDLDFWLSKCAQALNPGTKQSAISFAEKMSKYEENMGGWSEGMLAVEKKEDIEKYNRESGEREFSTLSARIHAPKIGFVNSNGDLVIPCKFTNPDYCSMRIGCFFNDGVASVIMTDEKGNWGWGFIDKSGREIIPFKYIDASPFGEGLAAVAEEYEQYYFIDKTGKRISSDKYNFAAIFSEGLCAVKPDSTSGYGYIDKSGKMVIKPQYSTAYSFKDGVAAVFDEQKHGYESALINKDGIIVSDYAFRPEYFGLWEIISYATEKNNAKEYNKAFIALTAYEKRERELSGGEWKQPYSSSQLIRLLGLYHYFGEGGAPQRYDKAVEYFKMIENEDSYAMYLLGMCYYTGQGVIQDYVESLKYVRKSAEKDNRPDALYHAGVQYYNGEGVEVNYQIALEYFQKAKEHGSEDTDSAIENCKAQLRKLIQ